MGLRVTTTWNLFSRVAVAGVVTVNLDGAAMEGATERAAGGAARFQWSSRWCSSNNFSGLTTLQLRDDMAAAQATANRVRL